MEINIEDNFTLLFDKNNSTAYKALQMLQKECEESDRIYCYMDKLADMIDNDNSYIRTISKERTGGGLNKRAIFFAPLFSTLSVFPN